MAESLEDVRRLQAVQGVAIFELADDGAGYEIVVDGALNRRIDHKHAR